MRLVSKAKPVNTLIDDYLRSLKAAEFMRTRVPGVWIPEVILDRMAKTPAQRLSVVRLGYRG